MRQPRAPPYTRLGRSRQRRAAALRARSRLGAPSHPLLRPSRPQNPSVLLAQVQKSLVYLGPNARLRRVVHDLIVGRDVRLGAIGGSITHGAKASKIGETDWFRCVEASGGRGF